jgi:putative ABC transport system permease protein
MITLRLAYRNIIGAGLRTWLNTAVLSLSFVVIIWNQGFLDGWNRQARRDTIAWEIGGGQYWHQAYDPYDPFTLRESHGVPPPGMSDGLEDGSLVPILMVQATIYPQGRMQPAVLRGIDPGQSTLEIPSALLDTDIEEIPALVGTRMAQSMKLGEGDLVTVRWRDANGSFDAREARVAGLMKTDVVSIDRGQIWIPLERLREMMRAPGEATIVVAAPERGVDEQYAAWQARDQDYLLADITEVVRAKTVGRSILYSILLFLALLAIFDTQVLSIFRRRREIGTLVALGMTRGMVVRLFTIEGAMHGILAALAATLYGVPLLTWTAMKGFAMPEIADSFGLTIAERIYPYYSAGLVVTTTLIIMVSVTIVSYIPTRRITKMEPTDAIRGRLS